MKKGALAGLLLVVAFLSGCELLSFLFRVPDAPMDVRASDGTFPDKVQIDWNPVSSAKRYEVYRAPTEAGEYEKIGTTMGTRYYDGEVSPDIIYWYRVRACNARGCSAMSEPDSGFAQVQEETQIPPSPTNISASDGTYTDRVRVNWAEVAGASFYEVYRTANPTGTYTQIGQTSSPPYDDYTANPGTTYWYKVRACNAAGCSALSTADSGYASKSDGGGGGGDQLPGTPGNLNASKGEYEDKIRVTWSPASGAKRYEVFRRSSEGGPYDQIAETTGTSYDDEDNLVPCQSYWYKVRACNENGCGNFSAPAEGWREFRMVPPEGVDASDTRSDGILVSWDPVEHADCYEVFRAVSSTATSWDLVGDCNEVQTASSYLDTTATPGVTYWYRVKACNEEPTCGCSGFSAPARGYRTCYPMAPENVKAQLNAGKVQITWDPVEDPPTGNDVPKYEIYRATSEEGPYTKVGEVTGSPADTSFTDDPPDPEAGEEVTYYYKVKACSSVADCGCGPLSAAASVTIEG